jgi:prevent-host-death family protein
MATSKKRYTIAQARDQLARLVHEVEADGPVEITRRGKPVAVLVSVTDYSPAMEHGFWDALVAFRANTDLEALDFDPQQFLKGIRTEDRGRPDPW